MGNLKRENFSDEDTYLHYVHNHANWHPESTINKWFLIIPGGIIIILMIFQWG